MKAFIQIITIILIILITFLMGYFLGQTEQYSDKITSENSVSILVKIIYPFFMVIISGIVGYVIGNIKTFREQKDKTYVESLPPILTMAYNREKASEESFNEALCKLWLYSNKKIAKQLEKAIRIIVKSDRGNLTEELQKTLAYMREDIQINFLQRLKPKDFNHIYLQLIKKYDSAQTRTRHNHAST